MRKTTSPTDTQMLDFIAVYVTEIVEVETGNKNTTLVQIEYWPNEKNSLLVEREGRNRIKLVRECLKEAIRVTKAMERRRPGNGNSEQ